VGGAEGEQLVLRSDGRLAFTLAPGGLCVWDALSGERLTTPWEAPAPLRAIAFGGGRLLTAAAADGTDYTWELPSDDRPADDLLLLAELLAGQRPGEDGAIHSAAPLDRAALKEAWQALRDLYPETFTAPAAEVRLWHENAAELSEALGLVEDTLRHLDALVEVAAAEPDDPGGPGNARFWAWRGRLRERLRQWELAAADYTRGLALVPRDGALWFRRGRIHAFLGQWPQAAEDFAQAARRRPHDWETWSRLGVARAHLAEHAKAIKALSRALGLKPNARECWAERGRLRAYLGHWKEAAADLGRAVALGDDRPWVRYQHALLRLRLGDRPAYRTECQALLAQAGQTQDAVVGAWAAWACVLGGTKSCNPRDVVYWAAKAREQIAEPGSGLEPFGRSLLGAAFFRAGQCENAVRLLEGEEGTSTAWDWLFLCLAHQGAGNAAVARSWLDRALGWLVRPGPADALPWHQRLELDLLAEQARAAVASSP
jgi:tetratricopeptide (TPR) repeat protein